MTLLEEPTASAGRAERTEPDPPTIDLTDVRTRAIALPRPDLDDEERESDVDAPGSDATDGGAPAVAHHALDPRIDLSGRMPRRGMRIRRLQLGSVALLGAIFFTLGFAVVVGTLVVIWNVAQSLGFVVELEDLVVTSLGLETFEIDGAGLFRLVAIGAGVVAAIGWLLTLLLAAVYNAAGAVFGGLAVETGPLQRRRRVFSLRHRRFVTVQL